MLGAGEDSGESVGVFPDIHVKVLNAPLQGPLVGGVENIQPLTLDGPAAVEHLDRHAPVVARYRHDRAKGHPVGVGRDQFHKLLRGEPRISLFEQTDAREISEALIPLPIDLIVCDASFIGLEKVLLPALHMTGPEAQAVLLFKPQFQVGPKHVGKGGIVTDEAAVDQAKSSFQDWLEQQGWLVKAWAPSPITGSDGNQEWLVWACRAG